MRRKNLIFEYHASVAVGIIEDDTKSIDEKKPNLVENWEGKP